MAKQAASVQPATPAQAPDRKAIRASALEAAGAAIASFDKPEPIETTAIVDSLRGMVEAFSPKARVAGGPRVTLQKAAPADVASYFLSTGLTRKELAAAAGVSTSVIATVQNEKGDRWSTVTFEAKQASIAAWMADHRAEIDARLAAEAQEVATRQAAATAKAAKAAARATAAAAPKVAKAKAPATAAKATAKAAPKPGRPSAAARQANRKARPQLAVVAAQA